MLEIPALSGMEGRISAMWKIILLVLALIYVLSPYDLFPDMVIGWGWIDDLVVLGFLWRYFYLAKKKRERFQKYYQSGRHTHGDENYKKTAGENRSEERKMLQPFGILIIYSKSRRVRLRKTSKKPIGSLPENIIRTGSSIWAMNSRCLQNSVLRKFNGLIRS